jgi:PPK2 family polyphosphate:nucleotide phosphotransferase
MDHESFIVPHDRKILLKEFDPAYTGHFAHKEEAKKKLKDDIKKLSEYQDVLYASNTFGVLIIIQALDAAGKDGTIKHVMSGVNPQGCQVFSFKAPSVEELNHDYLWRCIKSLPEKGRIGIFNRSYYEEVLVTRVHPELLEKENLPSAKNLKLLIKERYEDINNFEKYLNNNGIVVIKFFLNISKKEQKNRFLKRINQPEKNWKFSVADVKERGHWEEYIKAFEDLFNNTSTKHSPWYIIPADNKWFTHAVVSDIIVSKLKELNLKYPEVSEEHKQELLNAKQILEAE